MIEKLTIVDVETTGKDMGRRLRAKEPTDGCTNDAIVEVACVRVDLRTHVVEDAYEALVRPWGEQTLREYPESGFPGVAESERSGSRVNVWPKLVWDLDEYHLKAGTFDGVDWSTAVDYEVVLDEIARRFLVDGATLGGQNPFFDRNHLQRDFARLGRAWPRLDYHLVDLASMALPLHVVGKVPGVSLRHVIPWAYADKNRKQAHRAMPDVRDAVRALFAMIDYYTEGLRPTAGDDGLRVRFGARVD